MTNELLPAGFFRRLGAMFYDTLLIIALWMITLFPLVAISNASVVGPGVQSVLFVELFAFFACFWFRGQTLGMLAWRLTMVTTSGHRMTAAQIILRFMAAIASFACLGLGYFWILIDRENRSWSDRFSDTRVCYQPEQQQI